MKKQFLSISIIIVAAMSFALYGSSFTIKETTSSANSNKVTLSSIPTDGASLIETKCMICHKVQATKSAMLAPPFAYIKKKYSNMYKTEAAFHSAIVNFTINPTESKAVMFGALKQFKLMPKMGYEKVDLEAIANYIYANDFPEPSWN